MLAFVLSVVWEEWGKRLSSWLTSYNRLHETQVDYGLLHNLTVGILFLDLFQNISNHCILHVLTIKVVKAQISK